MATTFTTAKVIDIYAKSDSEIEKLVANALYKICGDLKYFEVKSHTVTYIQPDRLLITVIYGDKLGF